MLGAHSGCVSMAHQRSKNNAAEAVDVRRVRAISITQSTLAASSDSGATPVSERSYTARGSRLTVVERAAASLRECRSVGEPHAQVSQCQRTSAIAQLSSVEAKLALPAMSGTFTPPSGREK